MRSSGDAIRSASSGAPQQNDMPERLMWVRSTDGRWYRIDNNTHQILKIQNDPPPKGEYVQFNSRPYLPEDYPQHPDYKPSAGTDPEDIPDVKPPDAGEGYQKGHLENGEWKTYDSTMDSILTDTHQGNTRYKVTPGE